MVGVAARAGIDGDAQRPAPGQARADRVERDHHLAPAILHPPAKGLQVKMRAGVALDRKAKRQAHPFGRAVVLEQFAPGFDGNHDAPGVGKGHFDEMVVLVHGVRPRLRGRGWHGAWS